MPVVGREDGEREGVDDVEGEVVGDSTPVVASGVDVKVTLSDTLGDPLTVKIPVVGREDNDKDVEVVVEGVTVGVAKFVVASEEGDDVTVEDRLGEDVGDATFVVASGDSV